MFKDSSTIHIAIEIILFIAIIFWVSSTMKRTSFHIKSLAEKINELEDRILLLESRPVSSAASEKIVKTQLTEQLPVPVRESDRKPKQMAKVEITGKWTSQPPEVIALFGSDVMSGNWSVSEEGKEFLSPIVEEIEEKTMQEVKEQNQDGELQTVG